jgi:hypothetical protein
MHFIDYVTSPIRTRRGQEENKSIIGDVWHDMITITSDSDIRDFSILGIE